MGAAHDPTRWASRVLSCWVATPPGGHSCPATASSPLVCPQGTAPNFSGRTPTHPPGPQFYACHFHEALCSPGCFPTGLSCTPIPAPRLSTPCLGRHRGLSDPSSRSPLSQWPGGPQGPKSLDKDLRNEYVTHILSYRRWESHRSSLWARETVLGPAGSQVHVGSVMLPVFSAGRLAGSLNLVWLLAVPTRRPLLGAGSLSLLSPRGSLGLEGGVHAQPWGLGGQSRTSCPVAPSQELSWL